MENQGSPKSNPPSEEIDLGQLFNMIGKIINNIFKSFLRLFIYFKKNIIKLGILLVVGLAIGYGLNQITTKRLKTEVIVKPNLESKTYLYDVIDEIQMNLSAKNISFFEDIGVAIEDIKGFKVAIEPFEKIEEENNIDNDLKYLELLQKFRGDDLIADVLRTEILNKSNLNHRITFYYLKPEIGRSISQKLLAYMNSNKYFNELVTINRNNAEERIKQDQNLVEQIDGLVAKYSEKMSGSDQNKDSRIILDTEEQLDITGLLSLKNVLIKDVEVKKLEIQGQQEAIRIINIGKSQEVKKSLFGSNIVLIPILLFALFFLIDILKYLNRKAKEMQLS